MYETARLSAQTTDPGAASAQGVAHGCVSGLGAAAPACRGTSEPAERDDGVVDGVSLLVPGGTCCDVEERDDALRELVDVVQGGIPLAAGAAFLPWMFPSGPCTAPPSDRRLRRRGKRFPGTIVSDRPAGIVPDR